MKLDTANHPCFNAAVHRKYGRIHLPVAPRCNMQCNYCNRKHDCVNESRPGVTSAVLSPGQALLYLKAAVERRPNITVVGIAGPGDPFANPEATMETLRLVRAHFPNMLLCVATNGLAVAPYIEELAQLKVSHVTLTINAIDPDIASRIYAWIRDGRRTLRGREAGELLVARQREALERLRGTTVAVKVNSIIIPGINEEHIPLVAAHAKEMGADIMNCMALMPAPDTEFETLGEPPPEMVAKVRDAARRDMPQMMHCARCRADACGLVGEAATSDDTNQLQAFARLPLRPQEHRPYIAVATMEGMLVNQHLGEAERLTVFEATENGFEVVAIRPMPPRGQGVKRWLDMADLLRDCRAILVSGVGPSPRTTLEEQGLQVIEMEGLIEEGLAAVFAGQAIPAALRRRFAGCGEACSGSGNGCG